jgi:hypothetical protein
MLRQKHRKKLEQRRATIMNNVSATALEATTSEVPLLPVNPEVQHIIDLAEQVPSIAEAFRQGTVTPSQVSDLRDAIVASARKLVAL